MAISSDCSLSFLNSSINSCKFTLLSSCKNLPLFVATTTSTNSSGPSSKLPLIFHVNSSGFPSPILEEDASTNLPTKVELDEVFQDSQRLSVPDAKKFDSFLYGLLQDPRTQELAYEYYEKAKGRPEFRPEKPTLKLLIRYLLRSKKWDLIMLLSEDFRTYRVLPDAHTCSRMVASCITARKLKIVNSLLEVFKTDDEIALLAFDSATRGYNKLHMFSSTILVSKRMESAGIVPDSKCYCKIMEAYHRIGDSEKVVELFQEFESRKLDASPLSTSIYRILCESLGKSGRTFEALEYFRDMSRKGILNLDSRIYASLICSFASNNEVMVVEELFKEAEGKRMLRDPEVFLKMVLMYVEEGLMEKTLKIVESMKNAKVKVSDCILCAIVNGYCK